jgi:hypothetical protein
MNDAPVFKFRGDELIGFIWHIYALARIVDAIKDMPELPKEADPMEDQAAQEKLIRGWIVELQSLPVRADGTVQMPNAASIGAKGVRVEHRVRGGYATV